MGQYAYVGPRVIVFIIIINQFPNNFPLLLQFLGYFFFFFKSLGNFSMRDEWRPKQAILLNEYHFIECKRFKRVLYTYKRST